MILGNRQHTAGNAIRYIVDYTNWVTDGEGLASSIVTSSSPDVVVSNVIVRPDHHISFILTGGVVKEVFTVALQTTSTISEVHNSTINFTVVAP
jgi:hypothetical protein